MRVFFFFATIVALLESPVAAGPSKPELFLNINSDALDKGIVGALEPTVKWQTSGTVADCNVEGGLSMTVTEGTDMPYGLWARIKKSMGGVDLSAKIDTESSNMNQFGLDVAAKVGGSGTNVQVKGTANAETTSVTVDNVQLSQSLEAAGGKLTLVPQYNLAKSKADVKAEYGVANTVVTIKADKDKQTVTLKQDLGDAVGSVSPTVSSTGDIELSYSRALGDGTLSAKYKPNDAVDLSYTAGPWEASLTAPADSLDDYLNRVKVNVKRAIDVTGGN